MLSYRIEGDVAVLTMDDGKANAVGHGYIDALNEGLDRAEKEASAVVLVGRPGVFSAGFDLKELGKGGDAMLALLQKGANLLLRLFTHSQPLVAASTGHAIAAGSLILFACDTRFIADGAFKVGLNETAIGVELPTFGQQLALARLPKRYHTEAIIQSKIYTPQESLTAGFVDQVVPIEEVETLAIQKAQELSALPSSAYHQNKLASRSEFIEKIKASLQG